MATEREEFLLHTVAPYHAAMHGLISLLAEGAAATGRRSRRGGTLAECTFAGGSYAVRIVCRNRGIRPFLALMDSPRSQRCYLGRLTRTGTGHVFEHGLKALFDILLTEEILYPFLAEVREAVRHYALVKALGTHAGPILRGVAAGGAPLPPVLH